MKQSWLKILLLCLAGSIYPRGLEVQAQSPQQLKTAIQDYIRVRSPRQDQAARYFDVFVDLNGDGKQEAIVYVVGQPWCSTGGCTVLVLTPQGAGYRVLTRIIQLRPPVRVLASSENGWRTITAHLAAGSPQSSPEIELPFDGVSYPPAPNQFPARVPVEKVEGEVVIPESANDERNRKPLYP